MEFPLPPEHLQERVGGMEFDYDELGALCRRDFLALLPDSFDFAGARVLDFGAGAGRTLRHFAGEAELTEEFWGCDIDDESIRWLESNLSPPFRVVRNHPMPPLPFANDSLDLIYAFSVFSHVADTWSAWLLELHRVLKPDGTALITTMGPGTESFLGRPWCEDRIGLLVTMPHQDFVGSHGGPIVFLSEWWLREHWGRAFDVVEYWPWGFAASGPSGPRMGQGCAALRKRAVELSTADLERPSDDPREHAALVENLDVVHEREAAWRGLAQAREVELDAIRASRSYRASRVIAKLGRKFARRSYPPGTG